MFASREGQRVPQAGFRTCAARGAGSPVTTDDSFVMGEWAAPGTFGTGRGRWPG